MVFPTGSIPLRGDSAHLPRGSLFRRPRGPFSECRLHGFDDDVKANLNGLRVGHHKKFRKLEVSAWLGAVYWNVAKQVAGTIPLPGAEGRTIEFDLEYEPVEPINLLVGTRITWNKHFELVVEYGFWDQVDTLAIQGGFRF